MLMMPEPLTEAQTVCYNLHPPPRIHTLVHTSLQSITVNCHIHTRTNTQRTGSQTIPSIPRGAWRCDRADLFLCIWWHWCFARVRRKKKKILSSSALWALFVPVCAYVISIHMGEQVNGWSHCGSPLGHSHIIFQLTIYSNSSLDYLLLHLCPSLLFLLFVSTVIIIAVIIYLTVKRSDSNKKNMQFSFSSCTPKPWHELWWNQVFFTNLPKSESQIFQLSITSKI